ncbi:hypothetical protein GCM10010365_12430 [Streptomyces poonensis]|uniref:Uncharacterized protein n=1 Tax=Streptomyces poonensis TaxID=68255 RepID=A0A918UE10_9ACTN|nr:hypothetical protein GCM10010365_12430 [Streptomyces poonensis]GLJ88774.1 hypothetical protein GCM10017589_13740 [Streptomyces poonensis]
MVRYAIPGGVVAAAALELLWSVELGRPPLPDVSVSPAGLTGTSYCLPLTAYFTSMASPEELTAEAVDVPAKE